MAEVVINVSLVVVTVVESVAVVVVVTGAGDNA